MVIGTEPDAWDECVACGHDRDDHGAAGCRVTVGPRPGSPFRSLCPCLRFVDEPDAA